MAKKNPPVLAAVDQGAIMRQAGRDDYVAGLRDGRRQRAAIFGGPKNRRSERRQAKADCRGY